LDKDPKNIYGDYHKGKPVSIIESRKLSLEEIANREKNI